LYLFLYSLPFWKYKLALRKTRVRENIIIRNLRNTLFRKNHRNIGSRKLRIDSSRNLKDNKLTK